jgi:pimeloyl-ACP methyl ester carboxylesterase
MRPNDDAIRSRQVPLRTGPILRCSERGAGDEPVLLLHGYSDSAHSFAPILPLLPARWRVLAPDQRGHGDSDRPRDGYSMEQLAADAAALLDATGAGAATVVGHSMGSLVALRLALDHPERVARLVLVGSTPATSDAVRALALEVAALADPVPAAFVRGFQEGAVHRPVPAAFFEQAVSESRKLPARVW